ncbi:unnamed protein product, partial [Brassica oleracea]
MYPQGRMSHHFRKMCVGDHLAVKGPKSRISDVMIQMVDWNAEAYQVT